MPYIQDDDWIAMQKCDGDRLVIDVTPEWINGFSRQGKPRNVPGALLGSFRQFNPPIQRLMLDGELIGHHYYPFDVLAAQDQDLTPFPLENRLALLESLPLCGATEALPTFRGTVEKAKLLQTVIGQHLEGIVLKRLGSPYRTGVRSRDWLKVKVVKTCTCVVLGPSPEGKSSLVVGLHDGQKFSDVASVKVSPSVLQSSQKNDLVEVQYLHFTDDNRLREPVYIKHRSDVSLADCSFEQVHLPSQKILEAHLL